VTDLRYGPWSPTCDRIERGKQLRCLQAIIACQLGSAHPLIGILRTGEVDPMQFVAALDAVERLPALHRRRVLTTHAAVTWPRLPPRARRPYRGDLDESEPVGKFCDLPSEAT
jgi:hypothetical protein